MKNSIFKTLAKVRGKNLRATPPSVVIDQMTEPRPLPMGRGEFEEWAARILSGALLPPPADADPEKAIASWKVALANMIMHLGPTESHKPDAFFIHSLRKGAINQVAWSYIQEEQIARGKEVLRSGATKAVEPIASKATDETQKG